MARLRLPNRREFLLNGIAAKPALADAALKRVLVCEKGAISLLPAGFVQRLDLRFDVLGRRFGAVAFRRRLFALRFILCVILGITLRSFGLAVGEKAASLSQVVDGPADGERREILAAAGLRPEPVEKNLFLVMIRAIEELVTQLDVEFIKQRVAILGRARGARWKKPTALQGAAHVLQPLPASPALAPGAAFLPSLAGTGFVLSLLDVPLDARFEAANAGGDDFRLKAVSLDQGPAERTDPEIKAEGVFHCGHSSGILPRFT